MLTRLNWTEALAAPTGRCYTAGGVRSRHVLYRSSWTSPMYDLSRAEMARKNTYLVILGTHVAETLAIARIVRSRIRRKVAEATLAQRRRRKLIRRAVLDRQRRVGQLLEQMKIYRGP